MQRLLLRLANFDCLALVLVALIGLGSAGCGKSASSLSSKHAKLFQSAAPEIKAQWETAAAAMRTNGFVPALVAFKKLQQTNLTPEQLAAVGETATAVSDEMYAASNKGDARAKEAIAILRQLNAR